jgi:hypothetical protein
MSTAAVVAALHELAAAADALADVCDREAPDDAPRLHSLAANARALTICPTPDDVADLLRAALDLFAYRAGSFSEVYVQRSDPQELVAENERFDVLKARVSAAVGTLKSAAKK